MPKIFARAYLKNAHKFFSPSLLMTRIYVSISIFFNVSGATFVSDSVLGTAAIVTQAPQIMMWGVWLICVLSLFDIIINNLLPKKYCLKLISDHRHVLYMSLSMISFSLSVALITSNPAPFLIGRLWLDGSVATIVAFIDIFVRRGYLGSSIHIQPS